MKTLLTAALLAALVTTASAADLYVTGDRIDWQTENRNEDAVTIGIGGSVTANHDAGIELQAQGEIFGGSTEFVDTQQFKSDSAATAGVRISGVAGYPLRMAGWTVKPYAGGEYQFIERFTSDDRYTHIVSPLIGISADFYGFGLLLTAKFPIYGRFSYEAGGNVPLSSRTFMRLAYEDTELCGGESITRQIVTVGGRF